MLRLLACAAVAAAAAAASPAPLLSNVFASNAVLQRDAAAPIWGFAAPGATVSVTVAAADAATAVWPGIVRSRTPRAPREADVPAHRELGGATYVVQANETSGLWRVVLPPTPAGGP
jgi:sialate O-acetylesterase